MFSWNFAKSAEAMFSRLAVKKVCKFLLKKKLGQLILGDIDLNQLDVQLSNGTIQLSDLALNVEFINQKFGEAAILIVKEGSIGSLTVKLPWKGRNCEIVVDELEIVLAPGGKKSFQVGPGTFSSGQDGNNNNNSNSIHISSDMAPPLQDMAESTVTTAYVDIHEGVKTIAKMVKWLLTSFHVKIKKLILALDPSEESHEKGHGRTLVLRVGEVECGTGISEDVNPNFQETVDSFLGISRLTNFVKFDGAILEFLRLDGIDSSNATTPVITGDKDGFSGTIKLSIPWKNGSLDIRKLDADIYVDPLELRLQPSSIKSFMYLVRLFEELDNNRKSFTHDKGMESVYYSAASHGYSSMSNSFEFSTDKLSQKPETFSTESYSSTGKEKDTVLDAFLRGSHLISDWMTSPVSSNQDQKSEESDFGASVDQFFECFDELRTSQSALGNSGMWNWTCSVLSAITAASNLASGSLHIPSEQKHVETSLNATITQIVILFSFVDEDDSPSCGTKISKMDNTPYVHYINADFQEVQLVLQVCPQGSNFEVTVEHLEVSDHFSDSRKENMNSCASLIRNKQAAVQRSCPPLSFLAQKNSYTMHSSTRSKFHKNIYRDDVVKVLLLKTSAASQCCYITPSTDNNSGPNSFSLKLPPLVFWVNFHLISTISNLIEEIKTPFEINNKRKADGNVTKGARPKETLRGNISLLDARIILCFPCENNEDCKTQTKTYLSWNKFIVADFSSPLALTERNVHQERLHLQTTHSLHIHVGSFAVYFVANGNSRFFAKRVLFVLDKTGRPSVFSMFLQESNITGPWITKKAKILATSDGTSSRNKSTGKGHGLAFVTTTKDMEDVNSRTREEMVSSSSLFLHARLSPVTINLDDSSYQILHDLLRQVSDWVSRVSSAEKHSTSQSSILVECDLVEVSFKVEPVKNIKSSIQNELPGSWYSLKLKIHKFEVLTVSNTGGIQGAKFLWVGHGDGYLSGSITGAPDKEFVLISCDNSTRGRGNGEGSNILSSRLPGSDVIHMWDPENFVSQLSINIRCATIVAKGGRLDWFDTIISFFSQVGNGSSEKEDTGHGSSFVLNLIDIGLSYEPYTCTESSSYVSALLAASSLKLSNLLAASSVENNYEIKAHDLGLLLREETGIKNYVKVAEEAHAEAVLRMNTMNGHTWELECSESNIILGTCQDSASGLARLAAQLQQIFAPDVEESIVHLQTRWDSNHYMQPGQESNHSSPSSLHSSSSDTKEEASTVNLMDEISEGAFNFNTEDREYQPIFRMEDKDVILPELIEGYFLSDLRPLSELSLNSYKEAQVQVKSTGWYGSSPLKIVENHVLEKTNSRKPVANEGFVAQNVKGRVILKNIDVKWMLYAGSDWKHTQMNAQHASTRMRDTTVCLELTLSKLGLQYDVFRDGEICVSKLSLSVGVFSLNDVSKGAPWIQVLGCYQSKDLPRESRARALKLDLESVRPHPSIPLEEYRLQIALLPMRLHLHQSQLEFLISFFGGKIPSPDQPSSSQDMGEPDAPQKNTINLGSHSITEEALLPYFQKFSISPVLVRVDYIPSRVDLAALRHGKYVELVNLFQWKGVELQLKNVQAVGVYGWSCVCETIIDEWLEDISQNQIHKLLKGLPPIRSLVAVGSSAAKLVSLPVKNYRKDRRIVKGMQRGTIAFLRSVSLEAIGLGAHLAAGAHAILNQAEEITSSSPPSVPRPIQSRVNPNVRSSQPKDARQGMQQAFETISDGLGRSASALVQTPLKKYQRGAGVGSALSTAVQAAPGAAIAPASAAARAVHSALLGVRNSLDPEHKKDSMDKYLGTTRSQPR